MNEHKLQDSIRSVRHNKIQKGLRELDASALKVCRAVSKGKLDRQAEESHVSQGVNLNNLTAMEVNIIRPFMSSALDHFLDANGNA
jgi:hypothetical protein